MKHARPRSLAMGVATICAASALAGCGMAGDPAVGDPARTPGAVAPDAVVLDLNGSWSWGPPPPASVGMPAAEGDDVAVTAGHQRLVLLDATGTLRWDAQHQGLRDVAPAFTKELVLAPTEEGIAAYDRRSGRPRWEAKLGERTNTPAVVGTTAVLTTWDGTLAGVDLGDGRLRWRTKLGGESLGPPAAGAAVATATFATGTTAGAVAVDAATGSQRWKVALPAGGTGAPAVVSVPGAGEVMVVVAGDIAAHGLSLADGSERWRRPLEGAGSPEVPPLALRDGKVLVAHRLGGMAMLDARDGAQEWAAHSDAAAVRGGPAGPGPNGWFAMGLWDGSLMLARPGSTEFRQPPGVVTGVAAGPGRTLLVGVGNGSDNGVSALAGW